jgi:hypothetical protein
MLLNQFDAYIPSRWYDEGALVKLGKASGQDSDVLDDGEVRAGQWTDAVKQVSVDGTIAVNSIVLGAPVSGSLLSGYSASGEDWPSARYAKHSPSSMNQSFRELFAQFKAGVRLIANDQVRDLAKVASTRRHKKPDVKSWPKKLANDVKDADD